MMFQAYVIANKIYKGRNFSGFWKFNLEWSCYVKSWMSRDFHRNGDEGSSIPCPPPKLSSLWQCLDAHFDAFLDICPETYEHNYGFLRPIIPEVVGKFMGCGDFSNGFALDPPQHVEPVIELGLDDPFPGYDHEPVFAENWQPKER